MQTRVSKRKLGGFSFSFFGGKGEARLFANGHAQIPEELFHGRPAITIFYLALRALDTVEDDMTLDPESVAMLLTGRCCLTCPDQHAENCPLTTMRLFGWCGRR